MLGLKLATDPRWVNIVETNISEILTDHAWCEQKAASNAISLTISYPDFTEIVDAMLSLAKEELSHFEMVHQKIKARNLVLGKERRDEYVNDLYSFMKKGHLRHIAMVDRLLFSALIEARSCERFKLLSEQINDNDLRVFYRDLMISEANHYTMFIGLARKYGKGVDVEARWQEWLDYESHLLKNYSKRETIHG